MAYKLLFLLFTGVASAASLRTNDAQQFVSSNPTRNYVRNSGAEKNDLNITDVNNIVSRNTASTPVLKGDAQFGVDAGTSGHSACWALDALQGEAEGNAVGSFMFRGDASLYKAYVYNSTDARNASAETTLTNSTVKQDVRLFFVADPSKTYTLCVEATSASAAAFVMDDVSVTKWVGPGDVAQASVYGQVTSPVTAACNWATSATSYTNFTADSDCPVATATLNASAPGTKVPGITFASLPPGEYLIRAYGNFNKSGVVDSSAYYRFHDGTNAAVGENNIYNVSSSISVPSIEGRFTYNSAQTNITLQVQGKNDSGSASANIPVTGVPFTIVVYRFPPASSLLLAANAPGSDWTAFTPTISWVSGVSSNVAYYQCSGGNLSVTGKISTSGAVTASTLTGTLPSSFTIDTSKGVFATQETDIGQANSLDGGTATYPGRVKYLTTSSVGMYTLNASSTYGISNQVTASIPITFGAGDAVYYSYTVPVTSSSPCASSPSPWIKQNVVTPSNTTKRITSVKVATTCSASPCTITRSSGVSSVTRAGTGDYTINFTTPYSGIPTCTYNAGYNGVITAEAVGSIRLQTNHPTDFAGAQAARDTLFSVICEGDN